MLLAVGRGVGVERIIHGSWLLAFPSRTNGLATGSKKFLAEVLKYNGNGSFHVTAHHLIVVTDQRQHQMPSISLIQRFKYEE